MRIILPRNGLYCEICDALCERESVSVEEASVGGIRTRTENDCTRNSYGSEIDGCLCLSRGGIAAELLVSHYEYERRAGDCCGDCANTQSK
jgi:hypothetical protein